MGVERMDRCEFSMADYFILSLRLPVRVCSVLVCAPVRRLHPSIDEVVFLVSLYPPFERTTSSHSRP